MDLILDSSAILSGKLNSLPEGYDRVLTTSSIMDEIRKGRPSRQLESLLSMGLMVIDPKTLERAEKAASVTGDVEGLSKADLSMIALAFELERATVMTDDFRIQNVLLSAGIDFVPAGEIGDRTIRERWVWTLRCRGCGRYFEHPPGPDCPICGSEVRMVRKMATFK